MFEFTEGTKRAIIQTADCLAADALHVNRTELAEFTLDADRMSAQGYHEADKEVSDLIGKHGWLDVRDAAAKLL